MTALYNHEFEKDVISGCLSNLDDFNIALSELSIEDFNDKGYQLIFKSLISLANESNNLITPRQIADFLGQEVSRVGSLNGLLQIKRDYAHLDIKHLCNALKTCSKVRKAVDITHRMSKEGMSLDKGQEDPYFQKLSQSVNDLISEQNSNETTTLSEFAKKYTLYNLALENQSKKQQGIEIFRGYPTGFVDLDKKVQGLCPGHLIVVGARPGMGKTTFMVNLVNNMALKNKKIAIFSLEMTSTELYFKMVCALAGANYNDISNGNVNPNVITTLRGIENSIIPKNVYFDDRAALRPYDLKLRLKRLKNAGMVDVVFIDYLQLMRGDDKSYESNQVKVASISRALKQIAKEIEVPIVALAQVNRAADQNQGKNPTMADLRESGAIEADADHIWLLNRSANKPGVLNLNVAKNRFGECGNIELFWNLELGKIGSYSEKDQQDPFAKL